MYIARCARPGGLFSISQYLTHFSICIILQGSQEEIKKMDKRNKKGEHHERIDGIVECIVYFERF